MKNRFTAVALLLLGLSLNANSQTNFSLNSNGVNNFVRVTSFPTPANEITVEAWINLSTIPDEYGGIVSKWNEGGFFSFEIGINNFNEFYFQKSSDGTATDYLATTISLGPNRWYHVAATYSTTDNAMAVFVDGVQNNTMTASAGLFNSAYNLSVGATHDGALYSFPGQIDEVRIWGTRRTASQISLNMYKGLSGAEAGLAGYFNLDEGAGATATNLANISLNGSLINFSPNPATTYNTAGGWVFSTSPVARGYSGPAGVGATDGTSALKLWLKADNGVSSGGDNTPVTQWNDFSGNNLNASQASPGNQPVFKAAAINGRPSIEFNGTSSFLSTPAAQLFNNTSSPLISYVVFNAASVGSQRFLLNQPSAATSGNYEYGYSTGAGAAGNFGLQQGNGNAVVKSANPYLSAAVNYISAVQLRSAGTSPANVEIFVNGSTAAKMNDGAGYLSAGAYNTQTSPLYIGARMNQQVTLDALHSGQIAELMVFGADQNTVQRNLINNYLSSKYGITLAAGQYFSGGAAYGNDIIGTGRDADGASAIASGGGLWLANTSFAKDNGDYIVAGHNNLNGTDAVTGAGASNFRYSRLWFITKTDVGANHGLSNIGFDLGQLGGPATAASAASYRLLFSSDGVSFTPVTTISTDIVNSNQVRFLLNANNLISGYYTIGATTLSALPANLLSFTATKQGNSSHIKWSASNEVDFDRFIVERSSDALYFQSIGSVTGNKGTGKSDYFFNDKYPASGVNYYRLKLADRNGDHTYSSVKSVTFERIQIFSVYPNPVVNSLFVQVAPGEVIKSVNLFAIDGKRINVKAVVNGSRATVPMTPLKKGSYIIEVTTEKESYRRTVVK
ncbi:MAG: T9SS type A sorting domain-containing protein [Gemmatimonadaceae bacterium]|nr:T9SS type A sorting domain-containing protein [Chitinophagaceae bacterium]